MSYSIESVKHDLIWLEQQLSELTRQERKYVLEQYIRSVKSYQIGIAEYNAFVKAFDEFFSEREDD